LIVVQWSRSDVNPQIILFPEALGWARFITDSIASRRLLNIWKLLLHVIKYFYFWQKLIWNKFVEICSLPPSEKKLWGIAFTRNWIYEALIFWGIFVLWGIVAMRNRDYEELFMRNWSMRNRFVRYRSVTVLETEGKDLALKLHRKRILVETLVCKSVLEKCAMTITTSEPVHR